MSLQFVGTRQTCSLLKLMLLNVLCVIRVASSHHVECWCVCLFTLYYWCVWQAECLQLCHWQGIQVSMHWPSTIAGAFCGFCRILLLLQFRWCLLLPVWVAELIVDGSLSAAALPAKLYCGSADFV
jgi:hypothetical protein